MRHLIIFSLIVVLASLALSEGSFAISGPLGQKTCIKGSIRGRSVQFTKRLISSEARCPRGFTEISNGAGYIQPGPYDVIPSNRTVTGNIGFDNFMPSSNATLVAYGHLPEAAPAPLLNDNVVVVDNSAIAGLCGGPSCVRAADLAQAAHCPGSFPFAQADPGFLCIYPTWANNIQAAGLEGLRFSGTSDNVYGFGVNVTAAASARTWFEGVWAYTAP